jgi:hypothetical protein
MDRYRVTTSSMRVLPDETGSATKNRGGQCAMASQKNSYARYSEQIKCPLLDSHRCLRAHVKSVVARAGRSHRTFAPLRPGFVACGRGADGVGIVLVLCLLHQKVCLLLAQKVVDVKHLWCMTLQMSNDCRVGRRRKRAITQD